MQHSVRMKFCSLHLRYYFVVDKFFGFFLRLNKLLVESVCLRRLSCLESMSKETVMSQNYVQLHKDLQHFAHLSCGYHFVCMSILESSFQVFSGLYFWFGGFHALFEILTSLSAESIAT